MQKSSTCLSLLAVLLLLVALPLAAQDDYVPGADFGTSLHATSRGMGYWYDADQGGLEVITGIPYDSLSCKHCHAEGCSDCHEGESGFTGTEARKMSTCLTCHSREAGIFRVDSTAGTPDVHIAAGMTCMDCHNSREIHGDENEYASMKSPGAITTACEDCHEDNLSPTFAHTVHGEKLDCEACHERQVLSCTNCHFDYFTETGTKVAMPKSGWMFLMNYEGKVTSANMQNYVAAGDSTLLMFAPAHTHSVMREGRTCDDCHASENVTKVKDGEISLTWFAADSSVQQAQGMIPVADGVKYNFEYHKYNGTGWDPAPDAKEPYIHFAGFGTPLSEEQMSALASPQAEPADLGDYNPAEHFSTSLHETSRGMGYWYDADQGGMEVISGIPYDSLNCKHCHTNGCNDCHEGEVGFTGENAREMSTCLTCHNRFKKNMAMNSAAGTPDVHIAAGMNCMDCHNSREIHGDSTQWVSMKEPGAMTTACENCHTTLSETRSHTVHGDMVDCKACHERQTPSCTNCHFDYFVETGVKVAMTKTGWTFMMNYQGKVTSATMINYVAAGDSTMLMFAPTHTHSVMNPGRECNDCHGIDAIDQIQDGEMKLTWYDTTGTVQQAKGVIPVVDGIKYDFEYFKYNGESWDPAPDAKEDPYVVYNGFGTPLSDGQIAKLAVIQGDGAGPSCNLNSDGALDIQDLIYLLLAMRSTPADSTLDFNGDGKVSIADAVRLWINISQGTCEESATMLAAAGGHLAVQQVADLTAEDQSYLMEMMDQLNLNADEQAAYLLAVYGATGRPSLPKAFSLAQNSPNPFNPSTTITFSVPEGRAENVTLKVYDIRGKLVRTLVDGAREAGVFQVYWDGTDNSGRAVTSGVYFFRMQSAEYTQTRKMVLLK